MTWDNALKVAIANEAYALSDYQKAVAWRVRLEIYKEQEEADK